MKAFSLTDMSDKNLVWSDSCQCVISATYTPPCELYTWGNCVDHLKEEVYA